MSFIGLNIATVEDLRSISNSGTVHKDVLFKMSICWKYSSYFTLSAWNKSESKSFTQGCTIFAKVYVLTKREGNLCDLS